MPIRTRNVGKSSDDNQHPFDDLESTKSVTRSENNRVASESSSKAELSEQDALTLKHFKYNSDTNKLEGNKAIETTLN